MNRSAWCRRIVASLTVAVLVPAGCSDEAERETLPSVPGSMQIEITGAFARPSGDDLEVFFSMSNYGPADRLVRADASVGGDVRFVADATCSNDSVDVAPTDHIEVPASSVVVLRPGGCRTVVEDAASAAASSGSVEVTLAFAGSLVLEIPVTIKRG